MPKTCYKCVKHAMNMLLKHVNNLLNMQKHARNMLATCYQCVSNMQNHASNVLNHVRNMLKMLATC